MTEFEILNQLIKDAAKILPINENGKVSVTLNEPQTQDSSVVIVGIPPDAVIIKVDVFHSLDAIFFGSKGECKRADYVIVADNNGKKRLLYIEMKKTKDSLKEVIQQLTGARCFLRYCQEIGKSFWDDKNFLNDYQHRFVSIGHTSIPKRKTRVLRRSAKHDTPENVMKIDWPHRLQFNRLVGA